MGLYFKDIVAGDAEEVMFYVVETGKLSLLSSV